MEGDPRGVMPVHIPGLDDLEVSYLFEVLAKELAERARELMAHIARFSIKVYMHVWCMCL